MCKDKTQPPIGITSKQLAMLTAPIVWAGESGYWTAVNVASCLLVVPMSGCILSLHMFSAEPCLALGPPEDSGVS